MPTKERLFYAGALLIGIALLQLSSQQEFNFNQTFSPNNNNNTWASFSKRRNNTGTYYLANISQTKCPEGMRYSSLSKKCLKPVTVGGVIG